MLRQLATDYLHARRALGFELRIPERFLFGFADFAKARGQSHLVAATAIEWAAQAGTAGVRHRRLQTVALFARHVRAEDPRHEVPSNRVFPPVPRQLVPHIYTDDEARRLIASADTLGPPASMRVVTAQAFFALLFATGMRISEALALDIDDIKPEGLLIRRTKFQKTRLIPLHETARDGLARYLERRRPIGTPPPSLFLGFRGGRLSETSAHTMFRKMRLAAGLEKPEGQSPRIHDMRHTSGGQASYTCGVRLRD
jgi:integrase/recombinase XerD